jgi:hypothetical protein
MTFDVLVFCAAFLTAAALMCLAQYVEHGSIR